MPPSSTVGPLLRPLRRPTGSSSLLWARAAARRGVDGPGQSRGIAVRDSGGKGNRTQSRDKLAVSLAKKEVRTNDLPMSTMMRQAKETMEKAGMMPLLPGTFVSLPLSQYPRNPLEFLRYQYFRTFQSAQGLFSFILIKLKSMPSWNSRPAWKAQRRQIIPTANYLYRNMLEALAAGNKDFLRKICLPSLAEQFEAAIDRRNPRERLLFQLFKYNRRRSYPKLLSHVVIQPDPAEQTKLYEQAVVAIASSQKLSKYSVETGETIPGSQKVHDKVEYVVLTRDSTGKGYQNGQWRIWGMTTPTTLNDFATEQTVVNKSILQEAGYKQSAKKS